MLNPDEIRPLLLSIAERPDVYSQMASQKAERLTQAEGLSTPDLRALKQGLEMRSRCLGAFKGSGVEAIRGLRVQVNDKGVQVLEQIRTALEVLNDCLPEKPSLPLGSGIYRA